MRFNDLPVLVLNDISTVAMQDTHRTCIEGSGVAAGIKALTSGFDPDELNVVVRDIGMENPHGVGTATYRRHHVIWLTPRVQWHLFDAFGTDNRLEVPDHGRIGMGARHGSDDVKGAFDVGHAVAHGFVQ